MVRRNRMMTSDTNTVVLSTVAQKLAVKLSDLSLQVAIPVDALRPVMDELLQHDWVKAQPVGGETIYRITGDGALALERMVKKGFSLR